MSLQILREEGLYSDKDIDQVKQVRNYQKSVRNQLFSGLTVLGSSIATIEATAYHEDLIHIAPWVIVGVLGMLGNISQAVELDNVTAQYRIALRKIRAFQDK